MNRIAITGPESCGKSLMSAALAGHFDTIWVPEYARQYLLGLASGYTYKDILHIARTQLRLMKRGIAEAAGSPVASWVFFDTDLLVTKVWCDVVFGTCHRWIQENLPKQPVDYYLLMDIDLPWEFDPLREHPHLRREIFDRYLSELNTLGVPYGVVSGLGEQRLLNALILLKQLS